VAAYPPAGWAERASGVLGGLGLPEHRVTPAEQVHLTLLFIGETPAGELEQVRESVGRAASGIGAFALSPERVVALPRSGPTRLAAVETDAPPALLELVRRLARRLARTPRKDPADRFLPHLTLCRFRKPVEGVEVEREVELEPFAVDEVRLMRSVLRPEGAEHRLVETFGLGREV